MSCKYKEVCPSCNGWCENPKQDFSSCIPFLISAYENEKRQRHAGLIKCQVNLGNDLKLDGLFIMWEQYSRPQAASPFPGGAPTGIYSQVYGIVNTDKGVMRVDPEDIVFVTKKEKQNHE